MKTLKAQISLCTWVFIVHYYIVASSDSKQTTVLRRLTWTYDLDAYAATPPHYAHTILASEHWSQTIILFFLSICVYSETIKENLK